MIPARENILSRVRTALRTEAPRPTMPTTAPIWLPVGDVEARFRAEFTAVRGNLLDSSQQLREFMKAFPKIAIDGSTLVRQVAGDGTATAREADIGVTGCDCLVAQTGSIIVSMHASGERALSVLPPVHLVIARCDQIVPDLAAAFTLLRQRYNGHWPSSLCLITGPSRTSDIEKTLVIGAHGPKQLAVYFAG
ncbi:MAG: LUD domain-containing protein [Verrucomicrobiia bacterium]